MSRRHTTPLIPPGRQQAMATARRQEALGFLGAAEQLHVQGMLAPAVRGYQHVMRLLGERFLETRIGQRAVFMGAIAAYQLRLYDDAILLMELARDGWQGAGGDPRNPDVHYNLGLIYHAARRVEDAAESYRRAIAYRGFDFPAAQNNLGGALRELGDREGAEACYAQILASDPTDPVARYNLSHVLLLRGHLARGFALYESRWDIAGWRAEYGRPDITSPRLTRETAQAAQHVFVHQEQGIGDTLQFLRYLPLLQRRCGYQVTFEAPIELGPWLRVLKDAGIDVITRGQPIPGHDVHTPLLSLAHFFGLETEADIPPVWAPAVRKPAPLYTLPGDTRPVIGFAWAGNAKHHNDHHRTAPLDQIRALFTRPNTRFVSLQPGPRGVELLNALPGLVLGEGTTVEDPTAHLTDFEATAALVQRCDAVVTVDTSMAHLGGTLGVPTFVLTNWLSEWRWQLDRTDSPWYPSVRLVRQPSLGDWPAVARETLTLLEAL